MGNITEIIEESKVLLEIIESGGGQIEIVDNNPTNIAPEPTATNKDGNAQQIKVPKLENKLKKGIIKLLLDKGFIY